MMITPEIRHAIKCLQEEKALTSDGLAKLVGVAQSSANSWRNGQAKSIRPAQWAKLKPHLDPYLQKDTPAPTQRPNPKVESNAEFIAEPLPTYPVISLAAAASHNVAIIPIADFVEEEALERVPFPFGRKGDFAIKVAGDSMLPWYPEGTYLLVRPSARPRTGDRVVLVLGDGSVMFKIFLERPNSFVFVSVNECDGCVIKVRKDDHAAVRAVYKVIQSMRKEEDLDKAMQESGKHHFWEMLLDEDKDEENGLRPKKGEQ